MTGPPTTLRAFRPPVRWLTIRVRTLMALVLLVAGLLWGLQEWERRSAVSALIARLPYGVPVSSSGRGDNIAPDPTRNALNQAAQRVQSLHAERIAVSRLIAALRESRTRRDPGSGASAMRDYQVSKAAITALTWLGPEARPAIPELIRTLRDSHVTHTRTLAAHALGVLGHDDEAVVPALVAALGYRERDDSRPGLIAANAAEALGDLGATAGPAVPALIKALENGVDIVQIQAALALGRIGPAARGAVPALVARLGGPVDTPRGQVIAALSEITMDDPDMLSTYRRWLDAEGIDVREAAELAVRRIQFRLDRDRRREGRLRLIAAERARDATRRPDPAPHSGP